MITALIGMQSVCIGISAYLTYKSNQNGSTRWFGVGDNRRR